MNYSAYRALIQNARMLLYFVFKKEKNFFFIFLFFKVVNQANISIAKIKSPNAVSIYYNLQMTISVSYVHFNIYFLLENKKTGGSACMDVPGECDESKGLSCAGKKGQKVCS